MDTTVSRTYPLFASSLRPVRAVTPAASPVLPPASTEKVLFTFNTRRPSPARRSSCSWSSLAPSPLRKSTITCGAIAEINESAFPDVVLKSDHPVLVEFVATWCGPCRLISPAMEWLAQEYGDRLTVVKIDHDANPKLIEEYKVYGLPTLILFKGGRELPESRREGAITKAKLKEYVDALLETISVA